ncbi:MAG: sensor signal transduction histidine kinase [Bacteroidetes bacterium]|nr:sensor signal transduction histidine kinase [Bacteroidota bacterium]
MEQIATSTGKILGKSEMAGLIRNFNWETTDAGAIASWPSSLITSVNTILQSPVPIVMLWGPEGIMIYNDAYSHFAGARHPFLLGSKVEEGWPEVAAFNRNVLEVCLGGNTLSYKDMGLTLYRNNKPEEVWMDLNYSPIIDEAGSPTGVLAIVTETTSKVYAERKRAEAEEELKREQDHLRDLFTHAPSFIAATKGPDHVFEMANSMYLKLIGPERKVIGKTVEEALPEVKEQGFIGLLDNVYKTGTPFISDETLVRIDRKGKGELEDVYVNFVYQPVKGPDGTIKGIFVQGNDITEVVRAKKLSQDQSSVLEMITGGAPLRDALDSLVTAIEKHSAKGMKASILLLDSEGKRLRHGAAPSLPAAYNDKIDGIEIGPEVGSCGTAAYTQKSVVVTDIATDPLWKNFKDLAMSFGLRSCWSSPIFSVSDQKLLGTFALYYDKPHDPTEEDKAIINFATRTAALVIDRKKADEALKEREEHFRIIADNMQNLAWMMNSDGTRTWFNKQWYNYTGLTEQESKGKGWKSAHHPNFHAKVIASLEEGLEGNKPFELTFPIRNKKGEYRRFLTRVHPIKDSEQNVLSWIGTNTDIEEQENLTEKLESLVNIRTQELMRSNEDLQQFAHVASHDLKEPVRKIKTFLNILRDEYVSTMDPKGKDYVTKLHTSVDRIKAMIEGVLRYSTIDSIEETIENVDLNIIFENVQKDLELLIEAKKAKIEVCELPQIEGIQILLHQLFYNLINNSLKFSRSTVDPVVEVSSEVVLKDEAKHLRITLRDNGIGFDNNKKEDIFGTFKRLHSKEDYEGTGLGLALCKKIVARHGGEISAAGKPGEGAQFIIELPFVSAKAVDLLTGQEASLKVADL